MQKYCGVFRTDDMLNEGVQKIMELDERRKHVSFKDKSKVFNTARGSAGTGQPDRNRQATITRPKPARNRAAPTRKATTSSATT
jgi:hypothetical protein